MDTSFELNALSKTSIVNFLHEKLTKIQSTQKSYSLRAFARDLDIPAPILSEILRGKRRVTKKLATRICNGLAMPEVESEKFLEGFDKNKKAKDEEHVRLQVDEFSIVSDWYYFAILSLAETKSFRAKPQWISKRLGIKLIEAKTALHSLLRLGLLVKSGKKIIASGKQFVTTNDIPQVAIQKNHIQGLELAKIAIREQPVNYREFSASTISFDQENLEEAKRILRKFRKKFSKNMRGGESVYRLQIQFFSLLQGEEKK